MCSIFFSTLKEFIGVVIYSDNNMVAVICAFYQSLNSSYIWVEPDVVTAVSISINICLKNFNDSFLKKMIAVEFVWIYLHEILL